MAGRGRREQWLAVVEDVVARLGTTTGDRETLALLDDSVAAFVATDLIHRLLVFGDVLVGMDYSGHPGAGLIAGVAICATDQAKGRALLSRSREALAARGDDLGHGYGCFLEGLEDLSEGKVEAAASWWRRSQELLGAEHPVAGFTMAHLALSAYQEGDLRRAIRLAEQALAAAESVRYDRLTVLSSVYVAFFHLWSGELRRADHAIAQGLAASDRIVEPLNRYDTPLLWAVRGALSALRGRPEAAADEYATALDLAQLLLNEWHEAIIRSSRAQFLARESPTQAVLDAQRALTYFEEVGERWWSTWARHGLAATHLDLGDLGAADYHCALLLAGGLNDLERGRALLLRGELDWRLGHADVARGVLQEAVDALSGAGAELWAAQGELLLASVDNRRTSYLLRGADARAGHNRADEGWRRVLRGPGTIEVQVLGRLEVLVDGRRVDFRTRAEAEAVAMLVEAAPGGRSVDLIADRLWPRAGRVQAAHRVDNLLSGIRRALLPTTRIRRENGIVTLDLDPTECDLLEARRLALGGTADRAVAAELLRRPFLGDSPPEWAYEVHDDLARLRLTLQATPTLP